jgi:hypothetical protein
MNRFQRQVFKEYGGGDYSHATTEEELTGDGLALFLWRELADDGPEEMDRETAETRLETAVDDVKAALCAVMELDQ